MVTERWEAGIGNPKQRIRRTLVHTLIGGNATHSELSKTVEHDLAESGYFDQVLREISDFRYGGRREGRAHSIHTCSKPLGADGHDAIRRHRFPDGGEHGFYQLKDAYFSEYDPYFFYARRSERERADEGYRRHQKAAAAGGPEWTPPSFAPLSGTFQRLRLLFATPTMVAIIGYTLSNYLFALQEASGTGSGGGGGVRSMGVRSVSVESAATAASGGSGGGGSGGGAGGGAGPFIPSQAPVSQALVEMALHLAMLAMSDVAQNGPMPAGPLDREPISALHTGPNGEGLPTWSSFLVLATHAPLLMRPTATPRTGATPGTSPTTNLVQIVADLYQQRRTGWLRRRLDWLLTQFELRGDSVARAIVAQVRPPPSSNNSTLALATSLGSPAAGTATQPGGSPSSPGGPGSDADDEARQKLAAKRRQEEILKQFAQQQSR